MTFHGVTVSDSSIPGLGMWDRVCDAMGSEMECDKMWDGMWDKMVCVMGYDVGCRMGCDGRIVGCDRILDGMYDWKWDGLDVRWDGMWDIG